jgi:hypothetical protein
VGSEKKVSGDKYNAQLVESSGYYPVFPAAAEYKKHNVALFETKTSEVVAGLV